MNLNLGCGSIQPTGWTNIDLDAEFKTEYKSITEFGDNTFNKIVAHCVVQINEIHDVNSLLSEALRVLKVDGVFRISLPDIAAGFDAYKNNNISFFPNSEEDIDDRFCAWLTWYSTSKTLLTQKALINRLISVGFKDAKITKFKQTEFSDEQIFELDTRENECYFVEAIK